MYGDYCNVLNVFILCYKDVFMAFFDSKKCVLYFNIYESVDLIKIYKEVGFFSFKGEYYFIIDEIFFYLGVVKMFFKNFKFLYFFFLYCNIVLVFVIVFLCMIGVFVFLGCLFLKFIRNEIICIDYFLKNIMYELNIFMSVLVLFLKILEDS